jgi:hypothetical protein
MRISDTNRDWREDMNTTVEFMNQVTFSKEEIARYPYNIRRTYFADWVGKDGSMVKFYALDDKTAIEYLKEHYTRLPDFLEERINEYRVVEII